MEQTRLSERELDILRLVAEGHTNQAIAHELVISVNTVQTHVRAILGKLEVKSRHQAADWYRGHPNHSFSDRERAGIHLP